VYQLEGDLGDGRDFVCATVELVYPVLLDSPRTDKKENKIFLIYKEIQKGLVAKSYIINGLLIYD
jgi:hypothetical protein